MKYVAGMGSSAVLYIPRCIRTVSIRKVKTRREHGDTIKLLFFFFKIMKLG
jgi:hypothetical protein